MPERPLPSLPRCVFALLGFALICQLLFKSWEPRPTAVAADLPQAPSHQALRLGSLGEPIAAAQFLSLFLQSFDTQPGISIPFKDLDYGRLQDWLERVLALDPSGQYPLLMASQVPDRQQQRQMLEWVYGQFLDDPGRRWRWLAHAAIMAKHRLGDLPLALRYARALNERATSSVPNWARQMHIFLLEDMGAHETAKILLGGLLASGAVSDPHEVRFLLQRLNAMKSAEISSMPLRK
jgi:hypothetical protein